MAAVGELKHLTTLELRHTKVTDFGLAELRGLKNLSVLGLFGNEITDCRSHTFERTDETHRARPQ